MTSPQRPFSLERLDELYARFTEPRYQVFWRHDVDVSLEAALQMAEFEAERHVSATYYLFFDGTCPFYSYEEANKLAANFRALGHIVGEHVDERNITTPEDIMHCLFGQKVSFHCPTKHVLWRDIEYFESASAACWKGRYVSDSTGRFRYGDPEDLIDGMRVMQLNLHPERWFDPHHELTISPETFEHFFHTPHPYYETHEDMERFISRLQHGSKITL